MRRISVLTIALGFTQLIGAQSAQAGCVLPGAPVAFQPNDVSFDGFAFEPASAAPAAFEVDMNGVQLDSDEEYWATHGTLLVTVNPTGAPPTVIASWTKNTYRHTEEWVCRARLEPGTLVAVGKGAVHTTDAGGTNTIQFQDCKIDLVSNC
mgnify:CR=1 FL=1